MNPYGRIIIIDVLFSPMLIPWIPIFLLSLISFDIVEHLQTTMLLQDVDSEGNLCNITQIVTIDISVNPGIVEHVHVGQNYFTIEIEEYQALFKKF